MRHTSLDEAIRRRPWDLDNAAAREIRKRGGRRDAITRAIVRQELEKVWGFHFTPDEIRKAVSRVCTREEL